MKVIIISIICLTALALAEPPVGDGYPARSHGDHHDEHSPDHERSLSQEYGPPRDFGSARSASSDGYDYNAPNARNSLNARGRSQFAPAKVRVSFNQNFGRAAARNSAKDASLNAKSLSQEYSAPHTRSGISEEYGAPASRSLSQEYGVPSVSSARTSSSDYSVSARSSPSEEYGVPSVSAARTSSTDYSASARSSPSEEYGAPAVARSNQNHQSHASNFRSARPSKNYSPDRSTPAVRSQFQTDSSAHGYSAPSARSEIGQEYDAPKSFAKASKSHGFESAARIGPSSQSPSTSYGAPSARNSRPQDHDDFDSHSNAYSHGDASQSNAYPSGRNPSQEYGVPSSRSNQLTDPSSASARSSPSSTYLPASRSAAPLEQYGVPDREANNQGYDDGARARALEELQNQEPASYDFGYQIEDQESGSDFGHTETREENRAQGSYFVVRPDGSKQTVDYEADERGFKPRISVEPAPEAEGYDDNAQDVAGRAANGPY